MNMVDMEGNSVALQRELDKLIIDKNLMTLSEFHEYLPLFINNWQSLVTNEERNTLSDKWNRRVSIFHKVKVIRDYVDSEGNRVDIFVLPPLFTRVNSLNEGNTKADTIVTIFDNALTRNHPLRTDIEEALDLMKKAVNVAQLSTKTRLKEDIIEYHNLMDSLDNVLSKNIDEIETEESFDSGDLDWE